MANFSVVIQTPAGWRRPDSELFNTKVPHGTCNAPWGTEKHARESAPVFIANNKGKHPHLVVAVIKHLASQNDFADEYVEVLWKSTVKLGPIEDMKERMRAIGKAITDHSQWQLLDARVSGLYFRRHDDPEAWLHVTVGDTRYKLSIVQAEPALDYKEVQHYDEEKSLTISVGPDALIDFFGDREEVEEGGSDAHWVCDVSSREQLLEVSQAVLNDDQIWDEVYEAFHRAVSTVRKQEVTA